MKLGEIQPAASFCKRHEICAALSNMMAVVDLLSNWISCYLWPHTNT
jgi:hypothetical protein